MRHDRGIGERRASRPGARRGRVSPAAHTERRAACHLWAALVTSPMTEAAKRAVITFGAPETQAAAIELLEHLAAPREGRDDNTTSPERTAQ